VVVFGDYFFHLISIFGLHVGCPFAAMRSPGLHGSGPWQHPCCLKTRRAVLVRALERWIERQTKPAEVR
jgi:hypothetical protein